jgi:transposase InsO family protein
MKRCILDSGAGVSCTPLKQALTEFIPFDKKVGCANDTYMPSLGCGTLTATSYNNTDAAMGVELSDVWYVPDCKHTLISVKALQQKGCWGIIKDNWIQYYNANNQPLFLAVETELGFEIQWDLHVPVKHLHVHAPHSILSLHSTAAAPEAEGVHVQYINSQEENALLLHARTGHIPFQTLAKMVKEGHITGVNVSASQFLEASKLTCGICVQAKTARAPFHASQRETTRVLELVHSDLCEFPIHSLGGGKYVLVVIDDFSKFCAVKILKRKDQAKFELQAILNQWETLTGEKVHTLRTDRGGEFVNAELQGYLSDKGITHEQSIAYAHQQNGKAERTNRSLTDTVRALLLQAKFPSYMWAEAMQFACYLHNIQFKKKTQTTPQYRFLGSVPDVSTLRIFGCLVYYRVPEELRKKLDPRARVGFYLGPEPNSKGFRVLTKTDAGQLSVKAVRDIVSIEKYMIHGVPALQSFEHQERGQLEPAGQRRLDLHESADQPDLPADVGERGRGLIPAQVHPEVPMEYHPSDLTVERRLVDRPSVEEQWESEMLSQLSEQQAASSATTASLPSSDEAHNSDGDRRYSLRSRSLPDRYGDWNGSSVNWVKEVILALDSPVMNQAVSESVKAQLMRDAVLAVDHWESADLEFCEWASSDVPRVFAASSGASENAMPDPLTLEEALSRPDGDKWKAAADSEIESLLKNHTWELVPRQQWMKVLPCKWVLKIKTDSQGMPERYKGRLVVGGHRQVHGVDFEETFASVSKGTTQRALLSKAAINQWTVRQLDISTAFLHGEIEHEIYMEQPEGYDFGDGMVCRLTKCLYGLKQAPRAWFAKLTDFLKELKFQGSTADPNLWFGDWKGVKVWIAIVVDDTLLASSDVNATMEVEQQILDRFPGKSGLAEWYCGMKLDWQSTGSVRVTQTAHIDQLLAKHNLQDIPERGLPMGTNVKLTSVGDPLDTKQFPYASIVGALLYIACNTRPDIASTVNKLTKYMSKPTTQHWKVLLDLLGYLKATRCMGLHLGRSKESVGYCDSDYGNCVDTRRSQTGWVFQLYGGPISWQSKCQNTVATSTVEAEYQAASAASREALWLRQLFSDLEIPHTPMMILCDSQGALSAMMNSQVSQRTKHIDIIHHFVRERCQLGQIKFEFVDGSENVADVLTKPLGKAKHVWCCQKMGMW